MRYLILVIIIGTLIVGGIKVGTDFSGDILEICTWEGSRGRFETYSYLGTSDLTESIKLHDPSAHIISRRFQFHDRSEPVDLDSYDGDQFHLRNQTTQDKINDQNR